MKNFGMFEYDGEVYCINFLRLKKITGVSRPYGDIVQFTFIFWGEDSIKIVFEIKDFVSKDDLKVFNQFFNCDAWRPEEDYETEEELKGRAERQRAALKVRDEFVRLANNERMRILMHLGVIEGEEKDK